MAGLLDELLKNLGQGGMDQVSKRAGVDRGRTDEATGAALSTILRGLEKKASTPGGADDLWAKLESQVSQGHVSAEAPTGSIEVKDLDPKVTDSMLKDIFGNSAPEVEGRLGKVIKLDPGTTKKIMGAILPVVLGMLRGQAKQAPQADPQALPDILRGAREDMNKRQPKSGGILDAILDRDHDGDVDLGDLAGIFLGGK